jgi:transposase
MGKVTRVCPHLSEEELRARIKQASNARVARKLLVILNATVDPRPAEEIALHTGASVHSVHAWVPAYNRHGLEGILGPGTGGRRHQHMSREQERIFLRPFFERAETGEIATTAEIRQALEECVGHSLHHSVVYRLLQRNEWRKVMPRPSHVQSSQEVQEDFKKNSRRK